MRTTLCLALLTAAPASGHGGTPQVNEILFPAQYGHRPLVVTDNQGVFVEPIGDGYRWLCEDAVVPYVGVRGVAVLDADASRWLVGTLDGLAGSDDGGCNWAPVPGRLGEDIIVGLWPHPTRPSEVLTITASFEEPDDLFVSEDGGRTWTGAGLGLVGPTPSLLRAAADPDRIYLSSGHGGLRSDDGGRTFVGVRMGPPDLEVDATEFQWLGSSPVDRDHVYAAVERFPATLVVRSEDGGLTWETVLAVEDLPRSIVFDRTGTEAILVSPFDGIRRSLDGGSTWVHEGVTVERLGVVRRQPGTGRLWSSTNVFIEGPWLLAYSDDVGRTWTTGLESYAELDRGWACASDAATSRLCAGLCPGLPPGATCDLAEETRGALADAGAGAPDGSVGEADVGAEANSSTDGCATTPLAAGLLPLVVGVAGLGRRRKSRRRAIGIRIALHEDRG